VALRRPDHPDGGDGGFNYSYSIRIRSNNSVNYSYSDEYYTPTIRYSPSNRASKLDMSVS